MRKRVFGSIFLTAIVTLLLTAGLFLLVVHAGLTRDLRGRLAREGGYIAAAVSTDRGLEEIKALGTLCADRITLVKKDGTVLYDNETPAAEMENHGTRPEIRRAAETGVGEDSRLSETLETQTYYIMRSVSQTATSCVLPRPPTVPSAPLRARPRGSCSSCCSRCSWRRCSQAASHTYSSRRSYRSTCMIR